MASLWRSGSLAAKTDVSWPTSSCCVGPSERERRTSGSKQPALNSATPRSLANPLAKTTRPALCQRKRTARSQPQPISSKTSRYLASNMGVGAVQRSGLWPEGGHQCRHAVVPVSFLGKGEAKPYFQKFGHPSHRMTRVAINGPLSEVIGTGFAEVVEWEFAADFFVIRWSLHGTEGISRAAVGPRRRSWRSSLSLAC